MIYLNLFKQLNDTAVEALYNLLKDLINKNTTNILEVGTYAGQATVRLCAAASEKSSTATVISIDENSDAFSPTAEESLKANNFNNYSISFGNLAQNFEENVIKANIIYIDRFHNEIDSKLDFIKKNILVPTKVIFRNPKNTGDYPFDVIECAPVVKSRSRKRASSVAENIIDEKNETIDVKEKIKETAQNKKTTL